MDIWDLPRPWNPTSSEYYATGRPGPDFRVGSSALNDFHSSRRLFEAYHVLGTAQKPVTAAMTLGSLVDCLLTEPGEFQSSFRFKDEENGQNGRRVPSRRDKAVRNSAAAFGILANPIHTVTDPRRVITRDTYDEAQAIIKVLLSREDTAAVLTAPGPTQVAHKWERYGVPLRGRLDKGMNLRSGTPAIIDIKLVYDVAPPSLERLLFKRGVHRQLALYEDMVVDFSGETPACLIVGCLSKPPHCDTIVKPLSEELMARGRAEVDEDLRALGECLETGDFANVYEKSLEPLDLPGYARYR